MKNQKSERRIGMGTLGLGERLVRLGNSMDRIANGSLMSFIASSHWRHTKQVSTLQRKGAFHKFEYDKFISLALCKLLPRASSEYQEEAKENWN